MPEREKPAAEGAPGKEVLLETEQLRKSFGER